MSVGKESNYGIERKAVGRDGTLLLCALVIMFFVFLSNKYYSYTVSSHACT